MMFGLIAFAFAQDPLPEIEAPRGAWFVYELERNVDGGTGAYDGYRDRMEAGGRYDLSGDAEVAVHATYTWRFASATETDGGRVDREVRYDRATRRYTSEQIDLDDAEWAGTPPSSLAVWFAAPVDVRVGDVVPILDDTCTVVSTSATVRAAGADRSAIECRGDGTGQRNDDYGTFTTSWTATWWFDPATGLVLATAWDERDTGTFEGAAASFAMRERLTVTDASYAARVGDPPVHDVPPEPSGGTPGDAAGGFLALLFALGCSTVSFVAPIAIPVGLVLFVGWMLVRPPPSKIQCALGLVSFQRIGDPLDLARWAPETVSTQFAPFLEDFAKKALAANGRVVTATTGANLVGIGFGDPESGLGTILTADPDVADALRRWVVCDDFFTEHRHERGGRPVWNVYEAYDVLRVSPVPKPGYDTALVRRATTRDHAAVEALLQRAWGIAAPRWLEAQIAAGDLLFVAEVAGAVVGAGFVSLVGEHGRLHGLTVHPDHRDKGIGTELVRARLRALAELGASSALSEIATGNLASLHVARAHGFEKVSVMYVETVRLWRTARPIARR